MNLRSGDTWGYWGLTVAGLVLFAAGAANAMSGYPIRDTLTDSALLAFGALGVPVVSLFVLLRNRRK